MAAIDKPLPSTRVVPGSAVPSGDAAAPLSPNPSTPGVGPSVPDLNRFNAITGRSAGAPRSILTRASVGYNGPLEVGGVRFASTDAALDQIIVENGAEGKVGLLQRAYDEIA